MLPGKCLHEVFEVRARQAPDRIAVTSCDEVITYGNLDERANQLAARLRTLGVGSDVLVALCIDRGIEMIIGLLAILKAGGAYVPIDPAYPDKHIEYLLADSEVAIVVTSQPVATRLQVHNLTVVCVGDRVGPTQASVSSAPNLPGDDKLAYAIYTSGSTGTAKGVLVEHRNVLRLFEQTNHWFEFDEHDVWTMFHSISFDFSVWEIWGALLYGGRLVIVPAEVTRSPAQFHALLKREKVTVLNQTPTAFSQLVAADLACEDPSEFHLRFLIFGGEALDLRSLEPWITRYGDQSPALVNMYGITETTVHVTYKRILQEDLKFPELSPIGVPIPDLQIYLLDAAGEPVADGTAGELFVAGPGLARGYLNRPELTTSRFVERPDLGGGMRLYHSGDRAVRLPNGEFAYLSRSDDQIKVRGFRVEPQEVELCLRGHEQIAAACVIPHDYGDGDVRLIAYVVASPGFDRSESTLDTLTAELAARAADTLPGHMRPSAYLVLPQLPTTVHGKVDRAALKHLPVPRLDLKAKSSAAMTTTEQQLVNIWEDVLQYKGIGVDDDFFELGGTSLALVRILVSVNQRFGVSMTDGIVAKRASIADLAKLIDARQETSL